MVLVLVCVFSWVLNTAGEFVFGRTGIQYLVLCCRGWFVRLNFAYDLPVLVVIVCGGLWFFVFWDLCGFW